MKILLVCYGGLSTGIMKMKLEEQAKLDGYNDVVINAAAISEVESNLGDYDIFLLGPQIRYAVDDFKLKANGKPVLVISAPDFGMMRGDNVWKQVVEVLKTK